MAQTTEKASRITETAQETVSSLLIRREISVAAPIDITFESVLEELGPGSQLPDGTPMNMKVEPWPGGRLWRDLGNNAGHWWGNVQVIKPPKLLEICGPLFMSYPAMSHVQYRLSEEGGQTKVEFVHRAMGMITEEHRKGVSTGWAHALKRIKEVAEQKKRGK